MHVRHLNLQASDKFYGKLYSTMSVFPGLFCSHPYVFYTIGLFVGFVLNQAEKRYEFRQKQKRRNI